MKYAGTIERAVHFEIPTFIGRTRHLIIGAGVQQPEQGSVRQQKLASTTSRAAAKSCEFL